MTATGRVSEDGSYRAGHAARPDEPAAVMASGLRVSSKSSIPLYHQVSVVLQRGIRDLGLEVGDRFPAEDSVAQAFSVSRPTASRAIQELIARGWLVRKRGRGTFVHRSAPAQLALLNRHLSFADEMATHVDYSSRIITKQLSTATRADAEALSVPDSASLVWIRRLHTVENRPVMVCDSKLSADRFPGLEKEPLSGGSLYRTLDEGYGCKVQSAERCVEATELLDEHVAELLSVPLFASVLLLSGLAFTTEGDAVEHMVAYVREGVSFKNVIVPETAPEPVRKAACPRVPMVHDEAC